MEEAAAQAASSVRAVQSALSVRIPCICIKTSIAGWKEVAAINIHRTRAKVKSPCYSSAVLQRPWHVLQVSDAGPSRRVQAGYPELPSLIGDAALP